MFKKKEKLNFYQTTLFKKQLIKFNSVFNGFSNYQLVEIKKLIDKILKERK